MSIQKYPCGDCDDCLHIGEGEGLCLYSEEPLIVDLFDIEPRCPKPSGQKKEEE